MQVQNKVMPMVQLWYLNRFVAVFHLPSFSGFSKIHQYNNSKGRGIMIFSVKLIAF